MFEALCVQGHTLLVEEDTEYGLMLKKLQEQKIDCVEAVHPEHCEVCVKESLGATSPSLLTEQGE